MQKETVLNLSVIIPFKDKADLTIACLDTLQQYGEPVKEIILISNNSSAEEYDKVLEATKSYKNAQLLRYDHPFNYHKINNWGVERSSGKVVLLLNNDIELTEQSRGLLSHMYKRALDKKVGAVGCVLLFEDGKSIQHGGVYLRPGAMGDHLYGGLSLENTLRRIENGELRHDIREELELTAVTAAAVMIERRKYDQVHGLNEEFIVCGGDVDICLRLKEAGYKTILVGSNYGYMIHKESRTRSTIGIPYKDFIESYKIYIRHFDTKTGDKYVHWQEAGHDK